MNGENLRAMRETSVQKLMDILNSVWQSEVVSSDWKRGTFVKIPKKGNFSECSKWKGITLLSVLGKLLSNIIYDRIEEEVQNS